MASKKQQKAKARAKRFAQTGQTLPASARRGGGGPPALSSPADKGDKPTLRTTNRPPTRFNHAD